MGGGIAMGNIESTRCSARDSAHAVLQNRTISWNFSFLFAAAIQTTSPLNKNTVYHTTEFSLSDENCSQLHVVR